MELQLTAKQQYKHNCIKIFFLSQLNVFLELYQKLNGSKKVSAKNWYRFVNSRELFDIIYPKVGTLSPLTQDAIAHSEPIEDLGSEIYTEKHEIFVALPVVEHDDLREINLERGVQQHATRCFIVGLSHLLFKQLYKGVFIISKNGKQVTIDDKCNYVVI